MEWYDWFFLMSAASCAVAAVGIVEGVYTIIRERGPNGDELRRRRLGR
jgi:hypothetical protein